VFSGKPTILIVDDDAGILKSFSKIFQRKGYQVTVAAEGKEAIEHLHHNRYDVAVVDLALPDMEGNRLFPVIKETSPKTVRIMLTGKAFIKNTVKEADVFLNKPISPDKLLSVIDTALKNRNSEA
jgi:DNA-binding NtrC family response regulator